MAIDLGSFKGDKGDQGDPGPAGTITTVLGTADQVVVSTAGTISTVSLDTEIISAITDNTNKTGITQDQADEIDANTLKTGITQDQINEIADNTLKVGITTAQATAIDSNTDNVAINTSGLLTKGDGLSITNTNTLNLLRGATVLDSVTLPTTGGGGGTGVSDYNDLTNAPITTRRTIDTIVLDGTRSNVVTVVVGNNEMSTITMLDSYEPTGGASFVYNPDTANAVIVGLVNRTFTTTGVDIDAHLTFIANQVIPLSSLITWDGLFTSTTLNAPTNGVIDEFVADGFSGGDQTQVYITATETATGSSQFASGSAWSSFDNLFLTQRDSSASALYDNTGVGDNITITFGASSALFSVIAKPAVSTFLGRNVYKLQLGTATNTVGVLPNLTANATVSVTYTGPEPATSITLDLGTEVNINSNFTLNGGTNNTETIVNTNGTPSSTTGVSTTVTVADGFGSEVTSFTASAPDTGSSNIDSIGQQIADAVNNNTETPIDFSATYTDSSNTLVLTGATAGVTSPWNININNNNADAALEGDIGILSQSQDYEIINQIDTLAFPDGTSFDTAYPTEDGTYQLQISGGVATWVIA